MSMHCHLIEGEAGCAYAVRHDCVAVIVDALRASATAAALLHAGVTSLQVVSDVADAEAAKLEWPDALLFGERGGLPPEGFDYGNSPQDAHFAERRRVIFTTTTGAGRLVQAWGAHAVYMGTTTNATAVVQAASAHGRDIVFVPAGLMGDPAWIAQEDWVGATVLAQRTGLPIATGLDAYEHWRAKIDAEGIDHLFQTAPHAAKLRAVHMEGDIAVCARLDATPTAPRAISRTPHGCIVST